MLAPLLTAVLGLVVERLMIRRLYGRDPLYSLLLTFGLAYVFEDGLRYIWGAQSLPFHVPDWLTRPLSTYFFFLTGYRVFMVVLVAVAVAALFLILTRTRLGRSEEHTSELQSLMRISYAVFCLKKKITQNTRSHID